MQEIFLFLEDFLGGIGSGVSVFIDVDVLEVVLDGEGMLGEEAHKEGVGDASKDGKYSQSEVMDKDELLYGKICS